MFGDQFSEGGDFPMVGQAVQTIAASIIELIAPVADAQVSFAADRVKRSPESACTVADAQYHRTTVAAAAVGAEVARYAP